MSFSVPPHAETEFPLLRRRISNVVPKTRRSFLDLATWPVWPINPWRRRLPAQFSQHIEEPQPFWEIPGLRNECLRFSKLGGQGTKEEMHYIYQQREPRVSHGELPAINESRAGEGEINERVKIEERANCLQICCVK